MNYLKNYLTAMLTAGLLLPIAPVVARAFLHRAEDEVITRIMTGAEVFRTKPRLMAAKVEDAGQRVKIKFVPNTTVDPTAEDVRGTLGAYEAHKVKIGPQVYLYIKLEKEKTWNDALSVCGSLNILGREWTLPPMINYDEPEKLGKNALLRYRESSDRFIYPMWVFPAAVFSRSDEWLEFAGTSRFRLHYGKADEAVLPGATIEDFAAITDRYRRFIAEELEPKGAEEQEHIELINRFLAEINDGLPVICVTDF